MNRKRLEDVLVEQNLLSHQEISVALKKLPPHPRSIGQALLKEGLITEDQLAHALAEQCQLPYEPLTDFRVKPEFYQTIPAELMQRHPFVPMSEAGGALTVAVPDPHNLSALDELELLVKRPLRLRVSSREAILVALSRSEGSSQALKELEAEHRSVLVKEDQRGEEVLSFEKISKDQSPVVRLLDTIILSA